MMESPGGAAQRTRVPRDDSYQTTIQPDLYAWVSEAKSAVRVQKKYVRIGARLKRLGTSPRARDNCQGIACPRGGFTKPDLSARISTNLVCHRPRNETSPTGRRL